MKLIMNKLRELIDKLILFFYIFFCRGGENMMAMLIALNIIEELITFKQVKKSYKKAVKKQLEILGQGWRASDNPIEPKEDVEKNEA